MGVDARDPDSPRKQRSTSNQIERLTLRGTRSSAALVIFARRIIQCLNSDTIHIVASIVGLVIFYQLIKMGLKPEKFRNGATCILSLVTFLLTPESLKSNAMDVRPIRFLLDVQNVSYENAQ